MYVNTCSRPDSRMCPIVCIHTLLCGPGSWTWLVSSRRDLGSSRLTSGSYIYSIKMKNKMTFCVLCYSIVYSSHLYASILSSCSMTQRFRQDTSRCLHLGSTWRTSSLLSSFRFIQVNSGGSPPHFSMDRAGSFIHISSRSKEHQQVHTHVAVQSSTNTIVDEGQELIPTFIIKMEVQVVPPHRVERARRDAHVRRSIQTPKQGAE